MEQIKRSQYIVHDIPISKEMYDNGVLITNALNAATNVSALICDAFTPSYALVTKEGHIFISFEVYLNINHFKYLGTLNSLLISQMALNKLDFIASYHKHLLEQHSLYNID
jgi:hypothetical protein